MTNYIYTYINDEYHSVVIYIKNIFLETVLRLPMYEYAYIYYLNDKFKGDIFNMYSLLCKYCEIISIDKIKCI